MNYEGYEFYYEMMPADERDVYKAMYNGFINYDTSFSIPKCEDGKISEIFEKLTNDHPEIFYVKSMQIQLSGLQCGYRTTPEYRFSKEKISYVNHEVNKEVSKVIHRCAGKSAVDAEKIIHDYLVEKATYKDRDAAYSHEMPGVFLYGIGVCEGIAKAFKFLCDKVGIPSGIVVGNTKGETAAHAWNQVCLEGEWYHVDVTFDANLTKDSGDVRYDYFNVTDYELTDRTSFFTVPSCNKYYGFYAKEQKYAKCQSDLKTIMRKRTGDVISVQLPKINCTEEQLQKCILKAVSESLGGLERQVIYIMPNYDRNVFTIKVAKYGKNPENIVFESFY